jgi:Mn2+/Fe2+ NRAMP family transporter
MIMLMHMTANRKIMGQFKVKGGLMIVGWIATAVMAGAAAAMCFTAAVSGLENVTAITRERISG